MKVVKVTASKIQRERTVVNTKLDTANKRILRLVWAVKDLTNVSSNTDPHPQSLVDGAVREEDPNSGTPVDLEIDVETLNNLKRISNNPVDFACLLLKKLFPNLFISGRRRDIMELDSWRKKYVTFLHPDVQDPMVFRERVVSRINECLRRPKKVPQNGN
jgi:hypothetical protein